MIKAVFFDLYGTLAGFHPPRHEIQSEACAEFGIRLTPEGVLAGYSLADAYMAEQNATRPLRKLDPTEKDAFFAEYESRILEGAGISVSTERALDIWRRVRQVPYELARFDDVLPAMEVLRARGLILGLISNLARDGHELTESLGLAGHLDLTVTSLEVGAEKPHAPIFMAALSRAGAEPANAVHVGDQPTSDIEGARAVGINPVLLDRDGTRRDFDLCPRIESLKELPELVDGYVASVG